MKYILLVPDGMADEPNPKLDGKTPMWVARTPFMDDLAARGQVGLVHVTPPDMYPGSDAANMALLGYDPTVYYTGRGAVEAAAMQIPLESRDVAFRCSLVSTNGETLTDYSAGHVETSVAKDIIEIAGRLCTSKMKLFPGISYRHILRWAEGPVDVKTNPPHENMGQNLTDILPVGDCESQLRRFIWDSMELLHELPYNRRCRAEGKPEANLLWPWGQGRSMQLPSFFKRRALSGACVTAVDVIRGLARLTGLQIIDVPGATGYFDTDYYAKARYALNALNEHDFVWIHVESPDEAGHAGNIDEKIKAIECIDKLVVGTLLDGMAKKDDFRILIAPDHATPVSTRGHKVGPVPYLLFDSKSSAKRNNMPFDERIIGEKVSQVEDGYRLIDQLFKS